MDKSVVLGFDPSNRDCLVVWCLCVFCSFGGLVGLEQYWCCFPTLILTSSISDSWVVRCRFVWSSYIKVVCSFLGWLLLIYLWLLLSRVLLFCWWGLFIFLLW